MPLEADQGLDAGGVEALLEVMDVVAALHPGYEAESLRLASLPAAERQAALTEARRRNEASPELRTALDALTATTTYRIYFRRFPNITPERLRDLVLDLPYRAGDAPGDLGTTYLRLFRQRRAVRDGLDRFLAAVDMDRARQTARRWSPADHPAIPTVHLIYDSNAGSFAAEGRPFLNLYTEGYFDAEVPGAARIAAVEGTMAHELQHALAAPVLRPATDPEASWQWRRADDLMRSLVGEGVAFHCNPPSGRLREVYDDELVITALLRRLEDFLADLRHQRLTEAEADAWVRDNYFGGAMALLRRHLERHLSGDELEARLDQETRFRPDLEHALGWWMVSKISRQGTRRGPAVGLLSDPWSLLRLYAEAVEGEKFRLSPAALEDLEVLSRAGPPPAPPQPTAWGELTSGVWQGRQGPWVVVLEFAARGERLEGTAHIIEDGRKWTEAPITAVHLNGTELRWHLEWSREWQQEFDGRVDLAEGVLVGEVSAPGGPGQPMRYERAAPAEVPGLPVYRSPGGEPGYTYRRPAGLEDGWDTATPEAVGLEPARIEALMMEVIDGAAGDIHSLLIVKDGLLVVEEYFRGWSRDDLHRTASCTKSVASLLVGIAIDEGRIEGAEAPVLSFFPELSAAAAAGWEEVTLEHLLTMTTGLARPESDGVELPGRDLLRRVLGSRPVSAPGAVWRYANAETDLLAGVLAQATGLDAGAFAEARLFEPLGILEHDWRRSPEDGYPSMAAGLSLKPRDMARIGALVAARGRWRDHQVVSANWVDRSTGVRVAPRAEREQYGYLWWSAVPEGAPERRRVVYAKGVGSQFIFVSPALDLVAVTTGGNHANGKLMAVAELLSRRLFAAAE